MNPCPETPCRSSVRHSFALPVAVCSDAGRRRRQAHRQSAARAKSRFALLTQAPRLCAAAILATLAATAAAQNSAIATTKHNLSASGAAENKASTSQEVCVFCHTPHASTVAPAPLWNRSADSGASYTPYTSTSLDAEYISGVLGAPGVTSKLCLSCHDGTLAVGQVSNAPGSGGLNGQITMSAGAGSPIGAGAGATTGFTRRLGADLTNDHPISMTFNSALATRDGELRTPPYTSGVLIVDNKTGGKKPKLPLDSANQVQCTTCHEPHYSEPKFLRGKRLQASPATGGNYTDGVDQICLACHDKLGTAWSNSVHAKGTGGGGAPLAANPADARYKSAAATLREFPTVPATTVWQAGCLNCHDTHTVQGARRLLREGTDGAGSPRAGGASALENTCYQCHQPAATSAIETTDATLTASTGVPDIQSEFGRTVHMPIATGEQPAASEQHNIGFSGTDTYLSASIDCTTANNRCGADLLETRSRLGANNATSRHVECTDCHNPHRVIKYSRFTGQGGALQRTHQTGSQNSVPYEGNVASGVLRGSWGVQPTYPTIVATTTWPSPPSAYAVKKGDPNTNTNVAKTQSYLTREYQLCLKCHSDYGFGSTPRAVGSAGTPASTNGYNTNNPSALYTNQAAEFGVQANEYTGGALSTLSGTHQCEAGGDANCTPIGADWDTATNNPERNHRSWHPVQFVTGRTRTERSMGTGTINMRPPWDTNLGLQTMQCSDCHGHSASYTQGSGPILTQVQGPHGSDKPFLLKGDWDLTVRLPSPAASSLCGKCHNPGANASASGFGGDHVPDDKMGGEACMYCHVAIPHGWKNKNFLVNLRCVGQEVPGSTGDCQNRGSGSYGSTTIGPYYNAARLRVSTWVASGGWNSAACGGGTMEDNCPRTGG